MGPELRVTANGKDAFAPVGGTLNDILRGAGLRDGREAPATLQVWRPYEGKLVRIEFNRLSTEILGLVLIGGERITW